MTYTLFITISDSPETAPAAREWALSVDQESLTSLILHTPVSGQNDPYTRDSTPPDLMIQADSHDVDRLATLVRDGDLATAKEGGVTFDIFETIVCPVSGEPGGNSSAPLSFNVRYHAPVTDEKKFVEHYLAHHPPLLAALPGVRQIFCYVPVAWTGPAAIPRSNCILGNQVDFDSLEALNISLASDARHRLRDDFNAFPVTPGPNTHYALLKEEIL